MKKLVPVILILMVVLISCVLPHANYESAREITTTAVDIFSKQNERILVVPVWYEMNAEEFAPGSAKNYFFGKPLYLKPDELSAVHTIIPGKISIGQPIHFGGYSIISETGKIAWYQPGGKYWDAVDKAVYRYTFRSECIDKQWREDLIQAFKKSHGIVHLSDPNLLMLPAAQIETAFSHKQVIIQFLDEIELLNGVNVSCEDGQHKIENDAHIISTLPRTEKMSSGETKQDLYTPTT